MSDLINPGQRIGNLYVISILTITASSLSIAVVPTTLIWWLFFRPLNVFRFRHVLLWCYLGSDFFRALSMLIYSSVYLKSNPFLAMVHNSAFCDFIGTFNMIWFEYSDFAIFLLAVHTLLLITSPKCCRGGGLYQFKYCIGVIYFLIPCVFAVISLIPLTSEVRSAYTYLSAWCYFRYFPQWYRYAFSWGPRLFIMAAIVVIYFVIYFYVKTEIKAVAKSIPSPESVGIRPEDTARRTSFTMSLRKWLSQFPGLNFLYPYGITAVTNVDRDRIEPTVVRLADGELASQTNASELQNFMDSEAYIRFQQRRSYIERQMSFLFIYPAVYVFIYSFQITQQFLYYSQNQNGLLAKEAITYIADFIRPATGAINSIVFYWRESQSPQLLDRVDRLAYRLESEVPDRIEPDRDSNIQTGSREELDLSFCGNNFFVSVIF